ncbi:hypothetical protein [Actinomadura harenae]|uniref:Uncharacterized protein n=1 Tax=Actinomadura harenae TaxID=2483351 RepID=A0A3M2MCI0_9ACTN|nr:hypothetical protein [Actinomadura harenae]RMI47232.1 hypothetical protein EBO15_03340 [Actinomadura harenae]
MRKIAAAGAALALSGTLVLATTPAEAASRPKPAPQVPKSVLRQLPPQLRAAAAVPGTLGWDAQGPYIVWGDMPCYIHLFAPQEWAWAWGTGPCWF